MLRGGQSQRLDLGEFSVGRYVGNTVAQLGEGVVDGHGAPSLLLIGRVATLNDAHSGRQQPQRCSGTR